MAVKIIGAAAGSIAEKAGIGAGAVLLKINGHEINDVLDYRFYMVDRRLVLEIREEGGVRKIKLTKSEYEDIGLVFETYLMDQKHRCRNHCIFCFIDQLPKGLRKSLYFKDDDERLSFLMGNYITLTNLREHDVERIIGMHLSPINISVHTTNPDLRARMMGNPDAGKALSVMRRFARAGTTMNCQIVLCRGVNDGEELTRTLRELGTLYPAVASIAVVPVGLTKYRQGLYPLMPYDSAGAREVLNRVEAFGRDFLNRNGTRLAYPADEFFIKAGVEIPDADYYEGFSQLENGVGMLACLIDGVDQAIGAYAREHPAPCASLSIATGKAAYPYMMKIIGRIKKHVAHLNCMVYAINNDFFGENITVAGLVTGGDLMSQLKGRPLGEKLLIPASMLRREGDLFLDGVTVAQVEDHLGVRVEAVENDGFSLYKAVTGMALDSTK